LSQLSFGLGTRHQWRIADRRNLGNIVRGEALSLGSPADGAW
jgi:hypothetical protein